MSGAQKSWVENGRRRYHPQFFRWRNMLHRCYRDTDVGYAYYGGRGIEVCDRWHDFSNFADDMAAMAGEGGDIDRIDVDGPYAPENCRWATREANQRNQRRSHNVTWRGRTQHLIAWASELGIKAETLRARLFRHGWPLERAMTEEVHRA